MLVEKPKCLKCQVYLGKMAEGWICPKCKCEYYEKPETYLPYPLPIDRWYPSYTWDTTTGDPLPNPSVTIY